MDSERFRGSKSGRVITITGVNVAEGDNYR